MPRMRPGDAGRGTSSTPGIHLATFSFRVPRLERSGRDWTRRTNGVRPHICVKLTPMTSTPRTAGLLAALLLSAAAPASAATRIPGVRGPLPVTATSYPFGAADHTRVPANLEAIGYIEEEFLVAGAANVYDSPPPPPPPVPPPRGAAGPPPPVRRPAPKGRLT